MWQFKTWNVTRLKNSKCDSSRPQKCDKALKKKKKKKVKMWQNSNCEKNQTLKMCQLTNARCERNTRFYSLFVPCRFFGNAKQTNAVFFSNTSCCAISKKFWNWAPKRKILAKNILRNPFLNMKSTRFEHTMKKIWCPFQKLKLWQNSTTLIVTKLNNPNSDKTQQL